MAEGPPECRGAAGGAATGGGGAACTGGTAAAFGGAGAITAGVVPGGAMPAGSCSPIAIGETGELGAMGGAGAAGASPSCAERAAASGFTATGGEKTGMDAEAPGGGFTTGIGEVEGPISTTGMEIAAGGAGGASTAEAGTPAPA